jgi:hypothetical protein
LISSRSRSPSFDALPLARELPAALLFEQRGECGQAHADRLERGRGVGRTGDGVDEQAFHFLGAAEEHFTLVGEVAEEGSLGESGSLRDLRHRGLLEAAIGVERQRRLLEPAARRHRPPSPTRAVPRGVAPS